MSEEEYIELYEKFLSGKCTPEEIKLIGEYKDEFELLKTPWEPKILGNRKDIKKKIKNDINNRMKYSPSVKRNTITEWYKIAAILVAFIMISTYFLLQHFQTNKQNIAQMSSDSNLEAVNEGTKLADNMATLILADGSTLQLENENDGLLSILEGVSVTKVKQKLVFDSSNQLLARGGKKSVNKLIVPYGGHFQLVLTDGTKVWLNSGSDISFPVPFTADDREVIINGEAYFEVAHEKDRPFIVHALNTRIDVLGTHFNIKAYGDENQIHTTLLLGSVQVTKHSRNVVLKPGQKSVTSNDDSKIVVVEADLREALAWKTGVFVFNNASLSDIMRQISRLYDVEIEFRNDTENLKITGEVTRFHSVEKVLEMLELTGVVKFKLERRRIIVMT